MSILGAIIPWWAKALGAVLLVGGAVAGIAYAVTKHDARIAKANYTAGYNARVAEEAVTAAIDAGNQAAKETDSAQVAETFHHDLTKQLPRIEGNTDATMQKIKVIYRDVPEPVTCVRPAGSLRELDAARARANAAITAATGGL